MPEYFGPDAEINRMDHPIDPKKWDGNLMMPEEQWLKIENMLKDLPLNIRKIWEDKARRIYALKIVTHPTQENKKIQSNRIEVFAELTVGEIEHYLIQDGILKPNQTDEEEQQK